jgi:UPF0176 protein
MLRILVMIAIASFYKFITIDNCPALQADLQSYCEEHGIKGTILIATEGINGSISGELNTVAAALDYLRQDPRFADLSFQEATSNGKSPFSKLKIKIKAEIVTFREPLAEPGQQVGTYVAPQDWNDLIQDPEVLVIDTRNAYEVEIGTFKGAIDPHTAAFTDFPEYVRQQLNPAEHRKVAMFCTGGIRCEKATSLLLAEGFQEVYHLEGGILNYLKQIPVTESQWQGDCFVFDERVAVTHNLEPGNYRMCYDCGLPIPSLDADKNPCPHCGSTRLLVADFNSTQTTPVDAEQAALVTDTLQSADRHIP